MSYHETLNGELPPPSAERINEIREHVTNWSALRDGGMDRLFRWARHRAGKVFMSQRERTRDNVIAFVNREIRFRGAFTESERDRIELAVIVAINDLAQTDVRYWGVDDPEQEAYCTRCDRAKPIDQFTHAERTCDPCVSTQRR